ncbi:MAG: hypothetical protein MUF54_22610 [Polyangiaceae bacterium]|jgi:hypothetical protein|nr:hypothetical protein [Polyangiaceae bacterium]
MRHTLDMDPTNCPSCERRLGPIALITREDIVERIPSHLHLPAAPEPVGPGGSLAWDVGQEPMQDWVIGMDPQPQRPSSSRSLLHCPKIWPQVPFT